MAVLQQKPYFVKWTIKGEGVRNVKKTDHMVHAPIASDNIQFHEKQEHTSSRYHQRYLLPFWIPKQMVLACIREKQFDIKITGIRTPKCCTLNSCREIVFKSMQKFFVNHQDKLPTTQYLRGVPDPILTFTYFDFARKIRNFKQNSYITVASFIGLSPNSRQCFKIVKCQ